MRPVLLALVLAGLAAATATAQVVRVPNSGCPAAPAPQVVGQPSLGQGFGIVPAPCRSLGGREFLLLGVAARPLTLSPPIGCARGCVLAVDPLDVAAGAWRVVVPMDRALIGATFRAQPGCVESAPALRCVELSVALEVTISR